MKNKMSIRLGFVLLTSVIGIPQADALVSIGNGNYFVGFTDIEHPAPLNTFQVKIQRTYNSRSQFDGIFGYGWGSDYEAFLLPSADGSVVIQESGGGDKTRFSPKDFSKSALDAFIDKIVQAHVKAGGAATAKQFKEKITNDANERDEQSRSLGISFQLPVGLKLYSTQRGDKQIVTVIKDGYVREYADGKQEFFNVKTEVADQGVDPNKRRLLKGVFKVGRLADPVRKAQIFYTYDSKGQLQSISDKKSQTLRLRYNEVGKVAEAQDSTGRKATYAYCDTNGVAYNSAKKCGKGDLIISVDAEGSKYTHQYDSLHNLIFIGHPDGTKDEIAYWPVSSAGAGGVKSVKTNNGVLVEYNYWQDPKDKNDHYKSEVKTTYSNNTSSTSSYEYWEKRRADGSSYRYKLSSVVDGETTTTVYNECCGQPLQINSSSGVTKFEYYAGTGLPKEKDTPSETIQWEYHPKFHGKITKVVMLDKGSKSMKSSVFSYDESNGQLTKAKTSDGKGIALLYDTQGRIQTMVDQDKRKIVFHYANNSKPSEIIQEGVGSISVSYDKSGNIKDVKSKGGRQIAISVAAAFQNLLEIIKPAGIQPI